MASDKFKTSEVPNYYTAMAGEFYVLAQLFSRGYMASLTYGNAKSVDILVSTKNGKLFKLEVKTASKEHVYGSEQSQFGKNYEWRMSKNNEDKKHKDLYYCFVMLKGQESLPRFFIVRSRDVAKYVKSEHKYWLGLRRKKKVKDNDWRIFRIGLDENSHGLKPLKAYENKWSILPK